MSPDTQAILPEKSAPNLAASSPDAEPGQKATPSENEGNKALSHIGDRLGTLSVAIADASGLVSDIADVGTQQMQLANRTVQDAQNLSSANQLLTQTLDRTKTASTRTSKTLDNSAQSIADALDTTTTAMQTLGDGSLAINHRISGVDETVGQVKKASDAIAMIAQETQLLALNASVEAARWRRGPWICGNRASSKNTR